LANGEVSRILDASAIPPSRAAGGSGRLPETLTISMRAWHTIGGCPVGVHPQQTGLVCWFDPSRFLFPGVKSCPGGGSLTITTLSREMMQSSPVNVEALVGAALREVAAGALDTAMFSNVAATATTPAGIRYNVTR
jgi:hypothetical protein